MITYQVTCNCSISDFTKLAVELQKVNRETNFFPVLGKIELKSQNISLHLVQNVIDGVNTVDGGVELKYNGYWIDKHSDLGVKDIYFQKESVRMFNKEELIKIFLNNEEQEEF